MSEASTATASATLLISRTRLISLSLNDVAERSAVRASPRLIGIVGKFYGCRDVLLYRGRESSSPRRPAVQGGKYSARYEGAEREVSTTEALYRSQA